jgi:phosphoribosyl 1,2-cyclic phosphate phosphodiesterase
MVGERVRIDFGPDTHLHMRQYGLRYEKLQHLLLSHSHEDHWTPAELHYRRRSFANTLPHMLKVYANAVAEEKFAAVYGEDWSLYQSELVRTEPGRRYDLGEGLEALALEAVHDPRETCVNWVLIHNGRRAMIAHDMSAWPESTWAVLEAHPVSIIAFDCTYGPKPAAGSRHLDIPGVVALRDEMLRRGALTKDAQVFATHFSHNCGAMHHELEAAFAPHNIGTAYDGMTVEF